MLKVMRSHKFFTVFVLGAITIVITIAFVFWGIGPQTNPTNVIVAEVGKKRITLSEYERTYAAAYRRAWEAYKNEKEIEKLNLRVKVIDGLIDNIVLTSAAKRIGLTVTKKELQEAILNEPAFQVDRVFNHEVYARRLKLNRLTPAMYEGALKNDLLLNKMRRLIGETAELSAEEISILDSAAGNISQPGNKSYRLSEIFLLSKRELAVKAYVEGLKRRMKININKEFIF